jgi:glycosyltransferase involved in cell wall biosynthesis
MNILLLDQYSDLGGAQQCLLDLLPALRERGWRVRAAVPGSGPLVPAMRAMGVVVDSISCGPYLLGRKSASDALRFAAGFPRLAAGIARLADGSNADLIYVNGPRLLPAAAWAARRTGRPILFHCHSRLAQRYASWLAGCSLELAGAATVACCRFAAEPLARYAGSRLRIIYNAAREPPQKRSPKGPSALLRIGVVGRIAPEKGQAEFLRAARLLAPSLPPCRFVICGDALFSDPGAERYRKLLYELAAGLPVDFLGWRTEVWPVLSQLDLLVTPSIREPAATRVILEAYACRVPVVAFPSGGIPEVVVDGKTGFLVSPSTPAALAAKIASVLARRTKLESAALAGHVLWRERFTLERYRSEMVDAVSWAARRG